MRQAVHSADLSRRRRGISAVVGKKLPSGFIPDEDQGYALIAVQLPDGASLQRTKAVFSQIDKILADQTGIADYNGVAGFSFFTRTAAPYTGVAFIAYKPWDDRTADQTSDAILAAMTKDSPASRRHV